MTKEEFLPVLDNEIKKWRLRRDLTEDEKDVMMAVCYVDAYQCVRSNLYGSPLPVSNERK